MRLHKTTGRVTSVAPTASAISMRLAQMLVVLAVARLVAVEQAPFVVAAVGVLTAFAVLADLGAANFLLSTGDGPVVRRLYRTAVLCQAGAFVVGTLIGWVVVLTIRSPGVSAGSWVVLVALSVTQAIDGLSRCVRAPALRDRDALSFARPEFALALGKAVVVSIAWWVESAGVLVVLPVISAIVVGSSFRQMSARCVDGSGPDISTVIRSMLPFGAAGALSSLYSQSPVIIAGFVLPLEQTAALTVIVRMVQPMEIVPATVGLQLMADQRARSRWALTWGLFLAAGMLMGTALFLVGRGVVPGLFDLRFWSVPAFAVLCVMFTIKCGNYWLASVLMVEGLIRRRLQVNLIVGILAVTAYLLVVHLAGLLALTVTMVMAELCLGLLLLSVVVGDKKKARGPR